MQTLLIALLFGATVVVIVLAIEAGFRLGSSIHRKSEDEKESPVSAIAGSVLGLLAFILAFTFAIVSDRYDARKELVREEANAIRTAFLRSDFLPEPDRGAAANLLRRYLEVRLAATESLDLEQVNAAVAESARIQKALWDMAVANARKDMNSDVAALYIESLNEVINVNAMRVAVSLQTRVPLGIWVVLYALIIFGMAAVGYQTGIAGSRRTWAVSVLAVSFSLVIALIAALDHPHSGYVTVSQQPLTDLRAAMGAGSDGATLPGRKP
jgi:hypothetical protein